MNQHKRAPSCMRPIVSSNTSAFVCVCVCSRWGLALPEPYPGPHKAALICLWHWCWKNTFKHYRQGKKSKDVRSKWRLDFCTFEKFFLGEEKVYRAGTVFLLTDLSLHCSFKMWSLKVSSLFRESIQILLWRWCTFEYGDKKRNWKKKKKKICCPALPPTV